MESQRAQPASDETGRRQSNAPTVVDDKAAQAVLRKFSIRRKESAKQTTEALNVRNTHLLHKTLSSQRYFFTRHGSSYCPVNCMTIAEGDGSACKRAVHFRHHDLQQLLATVKKALHPTLLATLDDHATDAHTVKSHQQSSLTLFIPQAQVIRRNPYKTISETIRLAVIVLLRDVLQPYAVAVEAYGNNPKDEATIPPEYVRRVRFWVKCSGEMPAKSCRCALCSGASYSRCAIA